MLNKLVHEARGKCWHVAFSVRGQEYSCRKCDSISKSHNFQLTIINAYLKSNGVELETTND